MCHVRPNMGLHTHNTYYSQIPEGLKAQKEASRTKERSKKLTWRHKERDGDRDSNSKIATAG